jgi:glycine/D-amino acid oxidase-like deaminating enzyme
MLDYIIVGAGIAGISFSEVAIQNNKTIVVFDNESQSSSKVAAGIYNPVILKRFSQVWKANEQIELLKEFYAQIENKLAIQLDYQLPVIRKFFSVEEQNDWTVASDKPNLSSFLASDFLNTKYNAIESGYVDTKHLLLHYHNYLTELGFLSKEKFDHYAVVFRDNYINYKGIIAKHIIFAEGFGIHANPYFNYLPLDGTKGEILIIKAPNLSLDCILNASVYIVPLGNDLFKVGATYNWDDKNDFPTAEGKQELLEKVNEIINCDFEVVDHLAGVRPTVNDRRPIVGTHHLHKSMHILNGLGTRGVMLGPFLANRLFDCLEKNIVLEKEIDILRFNKKFLKI